MPFEESVARVESLFEKLDQEIAAFQGETTLHCAWGCGKCCFKADIEATILEFLPFANHLFSQDLTTYPYIPSQTLTTISYALMSIFQEQEYKPQHAHLLYDGCASLECPSLSF